MKITFQNPPQYLDEKMLYNILRDYKILNCEVLVRDENGIKISLSACQPRLMNSSYCRRLYRCHYERPQKVYQMVCYDITKLCTWCTDFI